MFSPVVFFMRTNSEQRLVLVCLAVMDEMRFEVGVYSNNGKRWHKWATFADPLLAMRTARRLHLSLVRRNQWTSISCVRIGDGTIFDLNFYVPCVCSRRYYQQHQEQLAWLIPNNA